MTKNKEKEAIFKEISPSEFFYRNRELAGFTNPVRALYSAVRELVENSLDACELAGILPDIYLKIGLLDGYKDKPDPRPYLLKIVDNGPGIDPKFVPNSFGKIFYGSKYLLKQSRGMFGMGGKMAILYGQITTNRPVKVYTSTDGKIAYNYQIMIDIKENKPVILEKSTSDAQGKRGTSVELCLEGDYQRAYPKIKEYLTQTSLVSPYANIFFVDAEDRVTVYERSTNLMPKSPTETKPHPYGVDFETLRRLVKESSQENLMNFLSKNFHRVGSRIAKKFLEKYNFDPKRDPKKLSDEEILGLSKALHSYGEFLQPDASCLSPLGEEILKAGIQRNLNPEFLAIAIREPSAYLGFPFVVEVALAYGGEKIPKGISLYRFANKIPLLYDESSDVSWKVIKELDLSRYNVRPDMALAFIVHICSIKVPYKTLGKEFIADIPEIEREIRNGIRDVLRKLNQYLSRKRFMEKTKRKANIYAKYLPLIAKFSTELAQKKKLPRYKKLIGWRVDGDNEGKN
ncbi:MAG: DNA topoisomerase VI subunit B [Nitrososphaerales archaeon]